MVINLIKLHGKPIYFSLFLSLLEQSKRGRAGNGLAQPIGPLSMTCNGLRLDRQKHCQLGGIKMFPLHRKDSTHAFGWNQSMFLDLAWPVYNLLYRCDGCTFYLNAALFVKPTSGYFDQ